MKRGIRQSVGKGKGNSVYDTSDDDSDHTRRNIEYTIIDDDNDGDGLNNLQEDSLSSRPSTSSESDIE